MTEDRARKRDARRLARAEGISIPEALRRIGVQAPAGPTLTRLLRELVNPSAGETGCWPECPCHDRYTGPGFHSKVLGLFVPRNTVLQLAGEFGSGHPRDGVDEILVEDVSRGYTLTIQLGGRRYTAGLNQGEVWPLCARPHCTDGMIGELSYCEAHLAELGADAVLRTAVGWGMGNHQGREIAGHDEQGLLAAAVRAGVPVERITAALAEALNEDLLAAEIYGELEAVQASIDRDRRRLEAIARQVTPRP